MQEQGQDHSRLLSPAGTEVPILGSDCIRWIELTVPSVSSHSSDEATSFAVPTDEDYASSSVIGDPPLYFIWRIHKELPNALELLQISADAQFPTTALRFIFPHALFPFAFIFIAEESITHTTFYSLYVLTMSGVVYLLKLSSVFAYSSCSTFPRDDLVFLDVRPYLNHATVTKGAASPGCLFLGRSDGFVSCFGITLQTVPGFYHELRDDSGFGRLLGFMSRGRMVGAVQDLVKSQFSGRRFLNVLHADGMLRIWDLSNYSRIFSHSIAVSTLEGVTCFRLWLGEANCHADIIPLAVLSRRRMEISMDVINVYRLLCRSGDRLTLSLDSGVQNIPLEEGEICDVRLTSDKIWILKNNRLLSFKLFHKNISMEAHCYSLREEFVSDQLFQSSDHCSDDLLLITHSLFSSAKDQILPFVSSIFLRRLLCPGVFNSVVLHSTVLEYNKQWTNSEFQSLSVDELQTEILSLVEHEVTAESSISVFYWWRKFCASYLHHWRSNNKAHALLVRSDFVGLIRKNSVSLFRGLENSELGSSFEYGSPLNFGLDISEDEHEILVEVLGCIAKIRKQLGKAAYAIFYELLIGKAIFSLEDIVPRLIKILEYGHVLSTGQHSSRELGVDKGWEKELEDQKHLRRFSIDTLFSVSVLCQKAGSWGKIFTIIESYLQCLVPKKLRQNGDTETLSDVCSSILVQATSQVVGAMFESSFDVLLFVSYLVNISGQINMLQDDICKLQLELVPMIQDIVSEWLVFLFLVTTPAKSTSIEDFSFQLSSLQIDSNIDQRSWNTKLGKCDFSLAFILLLSTQSCSGENHFSLRCFPSPHVVVGMVRSFISWIIFGKNGDQSSSLLSRSTELVLILLRNGQYDAVEASLLREKTFGSVQDASGDWCLLQHFRGCCLLDQVQHGSCGIIRERKIFEAIRCFFRASSGEGASKVLHSLSAEAGLPDFIYDGAMSTAAWKLHYYDWAMQIFERYNVSEGACQFAFAALEQVDEALNLQVDGYGGDSLIESATTTRGRLWANVFKFALDLNLLNDAYCAIISNPDEEIKRICLRRFIIVLFERGRIKLLSDGQLPFIGLTDKIGQELAWKAERSDILTKPNLYKLLYAFEMHRHNWRMAASYIYHYSARLKTEAAFKDYKHLSVVLQERLNGLSIAINILSLVHPAYAWIEPLPVEILHQNNCFPVKKARRAEKEQLRNNGQPKREQCYIDIEKLQNEFVLTSAEYSLSLKNVRWTSSGCEKPLSDLIDLLVQANLYDLAFTVILKFWSGSALKRELEKAFTAMAIKCCPSKVDALRVGSDIRRNHLLLASSDEEVIRRNHLLLASSDEEVIHGSPDSIRAVQNFKEIYKDIHARLPVTVAATLLQADPQFELPLWLVHTFKGGQKENTLGMTGQESSPASLFQLYVDYGRLTEATNLVLEYIELFASTKPADIVNRKKPFAVWFPYTAIEQLWCQLEKLIGSDHMVEQCEKLKGLLQRALLNHLKLLKLDSDDAVCSVVRA